MCSRRQGLKRIRACHSFYTAISQFVKSLDGSVLQFMITLDGSTSVGQYCVTCATESVYTYIQGIFVHRGRQKEVVARWADRVERSIANGFTQVRDMRMKILTPIHACMI